MWYLIVWISDLCLLHTFESCGPISVTSAIDEYKVTNDHGFVFRYHVHGHIHANIGLIQNVLNALFYISVSTPLNVWLRFHSEGRVTLGVQVV